MTGNTVNGSGNGARSGAQTLVLLAAPPNGLLLRALADGPKPQTDLRRVAGFPAQTTLRAHLKRLAGIGAIEKHQRNRFPGVLEHELTEAGSDLLFVADVLERWLGEAPDGPLNLGGNAAKAATNALAEGWSTTMLRALAAGPLSLTDLDRVIGSLSYPSLERRLVAMRLAGQVEALPADGRGTPYGVTQWLRRAVAPLVAATRWECRHLPRLTSPFGRLDVEAAFLLAVPLVRPCEEPSGLCWMAVEIPNGERSLAGVTVEVQRGAVRSCSTQLHGGHDALAIGSPGAWLDALVKSDTDRLELTGNRQLTRSLLDGLHETLFTAAPVTLP